jgi:hypothetical protein
MMHAAPNASFCTQAASRTFTANQPSLAGVELLQPGLGHGQRASVNALGNEVSSSTPSSRTTARSSIRTPPTPGR